jgi:hypothetical protein
MASTVNIDTSAERSAISPYIYGSNYDFEGYEGTIPSVSTASRLGGNRLTGYNWENNASNAGTEWKNSSDNYLTMHLSEDKQNIPGIVVTNFQDGCLKNGDSYSLVTLPMAGYAAKDKNGTVSEAETAPSARWVEVKPKKGSAFSDTPDVNDNYVYIDEFVHFLVGKYRDASTATGMKGYSLDNEPGLWFSSHPRIHVNKTQCAELISKSIELSKAVKDVDSYAEIFGPDLYGMGDYENLQSAPDWDSVKGSYNWFVEYYLAQMKTAADNDGRRLLDVFDFHYYSEAKGGSVRITEQTDYSNLDCNKARVQAPRTLWDSTYTEDSWIGQWRKSYLPLLPKMQQSIDAYYPGTKLGVTEYNFGGGDHISGGIAQADTFGIFGKQGVYFAAFWPLSGKNDYIQAAFNLYRDYDGNKSTYGDTKVKADTSDIENSSVYASVLNNDDSKLHIIMINKNYDQSMTVTFNVKGSKNYTSGRVWAFAQDSASITERTPITNISGNQFSYEIPALTVCHIVLTALSEPVSTVAVQAVNSITSATTNSIIPRLKITNSGQTAVSLNTVKIRYYYTIDGDKEQSFWCDNAEITSPSYQDITSSVTGTFVKMATAKTGADYYAEIGFTAAAGSLASGQTLELQIRFAKIDWSNYNQTDDYSFNASAPTYADTNKIPLYISSQLSCGTEP